MIYSLASGDWKVELLLQSVEMRAESTKSKYLIQWIVERTYGELMLYTYRNQSILIMGMAMVRLKLVVDRRKKKAD